jgi:hypothetical protein
MKVLNQKESGWLLALSWLSALEETARDFHGIRPMAFCERAYEHATDHFLQSLENDYGIQPNKVTTIKKAIEEYIRLAVIGGIFQDASQFNLTEINPNRIEIVGHECPYKKVYDKLLNQGLQTKDLTNATLGSFCSAVRLMAGIDCTYGITKLSQNGFEGFVERR